MLCRNSCQHIAHNHFSRILRPPASPGCSSCPPPVELLVVVAYRLSSPQRIPGNAVAQKLRSMRGLKLRPMSGPLFRNVFLFKWLGSANLPLQATPGDVKKTESFAENFLAFTSQASASLSIRIRFRFALTSLATHATKVLDIWQRTDTDAETCFLIIRSTTGMTRDPVHNFACHPLPPKLWSPHDKTNVISCNWPGSNSPRSWTSMG